MKFVSRPYLGVSKLFLVCLNKNIKKKVLPYKKHESFSYFFVF